MSKELISTKYNSLADYIGRPLNIVRWYKEFEYPPSEVQIVADYPDTVLIELAYTACEFGAKVPPRKILKQITKAAIATGDVNLRVIETGEFLSGAVVNSKLRYKEDDEREASRWNNH